MLFELSVRKKKFLHNKQYHEFVLHKINIKMKLFLGETQRTQTKCNLSAFC